MILRHYIQPKRPLRESYRLEEERKSGLPGTEPKATETTKAQHPS